MPLAEEMQRLRDINTEKARELRDVRSKLAGSVPRDEMNRQNAVKAEELREQRELWHAAGDEIELLNKKLARAEADMEKMRDDIDARDDELESLKKTLAAQRKDNLDMISPAVHEAQMEERRKRIQDLEDELGEYRNRVVGHLGDKINDKPHAHPDAVRPAHEHFKDMAKGVNRELQVIGDIINPEDGSVPAADLDRVLGNVEQELREAEKKEKKYRRDSALIPLLCVHG
eukprot:TRINITY_DN2313_c0_g1_i1.p1 TRINITY_DN2313_c0_g1~~TRINITY_DN2313_c0_g1_i1.p1  ORF type:complete len:230 (-),score=66.10 TRINITY_DN2313_c0_g1_i1:15-704(-)